MNQYGTWSAYAGRDAWLLAAGLLVIAGILAFLGSRLRHPVGVTRPGKFVGGLLVVIWVLALANVAVATGAYLHALTQQMGSYTPPVDPITPYTGLSALVTFVVIALVTRRHGWKIALGSAIAGTIAAPMIFELPFDLIVAARTYPPQPAALYTLLFFLPVFLWEFASYGLLALSPVIKLTRYTLFALAAMFFMFAVWAVFGFGYPSYPTPIVLNVIAKVLCFVTVVTLFLPPKAEQVASAGGYGAASLSRG